ncbi:MAG TPA: DUF1858 domain-containing protein [Chloroflexota bacterium]|jgi:hybrid cluster-associated redox disulfide protein
MRIVTKESTLGEVVLAHPDAQAVLLHYGMACTRCLAFLDDTIEEAARLHGIDPDIFLADINAAIRRN